MERFNTIFYGSMLLGSNDAATGKSPTRFWLICLSTPQAMLEMKGDKDSRLLGLNQNRRTWQGMKSFNVTAQTRYEEPGYHWVFSNKGPQLSALGVNYKF